jgi:exosortase
LTTQDAEVRVGARFHHPALWAAGLLLAALFAIYMPTLVRMVRHWHAISDHSHGFVIAPLALFFAFEQRGALRRAPVEISWWGLVPLFLSLCALTMGRFGVELMSVRVAFVLGLIGLVLLLFGRRVFRILAFPLGFLFLMVPLPQSLINFVAFPLQLFAADWAVRMLHAVGLPVLREGNILHLPETTLFVQEACSGLRSLMALLSLGVVFAYFFRRGWGQRIVLVLSTLPIAIAVNAFRVAVTGWLAYHYGSDAARGAIHEFQGLITFGGAFSLLLAESWLLTKIWPARPAKRAAQRAEGERSPER